MFRRDLVAQLQSLVAHGVVVAVCSQCLYEPSDFSVYEVGQKVLEQVDDAELTTAGDCGVFATMGGNPESDRAKDWFARQCEAIVGEDRGNTLTAHFLCQGKIDPALIERMKKLPGYQETPESVARREKAATHPDENDLSALVQVFREGFGG